MLRFIITLLTCCCLLVSCSQNDPVFRDEKNNAVQLSKLKGKWVIVNYWAEWCGSCVQEISELNDFNEHNKDKNILLYGVNYDHREKSDLIEIIKQLDIEFPVLTADPKKAWHLDDVVLLPTTFIINPKGKVVKMVMGPNNEADLLKLVNSLQSQ